MAEFPIACNLQGDYGYKVIVIDDADTVADIIRKTTDQLIGVLVAPFPPDTVLKAKIHGAETPLADTATVKDAAIIQMAAIDIYAES
jgi:Trk K+ transport system NAD-binding subunit